MKNLTKISTENLQLQISELREELFDRQISGAAEFANYDNSKNKYIFVESVNTMMVQPDIKAYYIGIDDYNDQQITLVFPISCICEIAQHLSEKPNFERIKLLTQDDLNELPSESFAVLNDLPIKDSNSPQPFPKKEYNIPEPCTAEEFEQALKNLMDSGATLANWSEDSGENPIMYELPSNPTYEKYTIEPITNIDKLKQEFKESKYSVEASMFFSVFNVSKLNNPHTFELLKNDEGEDMSEILTDIENFQVIIDYPLEKPVLVKFGKLTGKYGDREYNANSLGYVLSQISQAYLDIYENHLNYGIWGHSLSNLHFEVLTITEKGNITLFIGS
jgi:hypothetical protein